MTVWAASSAKKVRVITQQNKTKKREEEKEKCNIE